MHGLTSKQEAVLNFVREEAGRKGYPPTLKEIASHFHFKSFNAARDHLRALERKGYLKREGEGARALTVQGAGETSIPAHPPSPSSSTGGYGGLRSPPPERVRQARIPVLGHVPAGDPVMTEEHFEGTLDWENMFPADSGLFALRVKGESMVGDGILDGDYVIVKDDGNLPNGSITVLFVDGEATVKRIYRDGRLLRLQPSNPAFTPRVYDLASTPVQICGKVVGVVRSK